MIVLKFGGTSVKDAEAMRKAISIVSGNIQQPQVVVLSATAGTTDDLISMIEASAIGDYDKSRELLNKVEKRHKKIISALLTDDGLRSFAFQLAGELFSELRILNEGVSLLRECTPKSIDSCSAYGELLSTSIFEAACRQEGIDSIFIDARRVMKTDGNHGNAQPNFKAIRAGTEKYFRPHLENGKAVITQGFIGSDEKGSTTTIGRGGSDYSAAVIGSALDADEIQIWTDVPGVLSADPGIVPDTFTIGQMCFDEIREMSFYGAKVLHPETIKPAVEKNIPVKVLNTFDPLNTGTTILEKTVKIDRMFNSVVLLDNCLVLKKKFPDAISKASSLSSIYDFISKTGIKLLGSFDFEIMANIVIESRRRDEADIKEFIFEFGLDVEEVSLIALTGPGMSSAAGIEPSGVINKLGTLRKMNPSGLILGNSLNSVIFITGRNEALPLLKEIHKKIIR